MEKTPHLTTLRKDKVRKSVEGGHNGKTGKTQILHTYFGPQRGSTEVDFYQSYAKKLMPRKKIPKSNFYPSVTLGLC